MYELKVSFNNPSKKDLTITWDRLCLVADINIPNPNTYQLLDDKPHEIRRTRTRHKKTMDA